MPDWLGLEGKRVLVAGGAGTLGAALVEGFLAAEARVGVADLRLDGLDDRVVARHAADLSEAEAARGAVAAIRDELGGLDVFVHCVGINDRRPIEDYAASDWDRIVEGKAGGEGSFGLAYPYEVSVRCGGLKLVYWGIDRYREAMEDPE